MLLRVDSVSMNSFKFLSKPWTRSPISSWETWVEVYEKSGLCFGCLGDVLMASI